MMTENAVMIQPEQRTLSPQSIPAQVFLNHFFALYYYIEHDLRAYYVSDLPYFQSFSPTLSSEVGDSVKRHLLNSWNTEYTLRSTAEQGSAEYLRHSLHWTYPQAYYAVQESLMAMLRLHDNTTRRPEWVTQAGSRLIVRGAYPRVASFYAIGNPQRPQLRRLPFGQTNPGLQLTQSVQEAQQQIGQFLRTTHRQRGQQLRTVVQNDPALALRSERTGKILRRFDDAQWGKLGQQVGATTIFHLLGRLRVSDSHREIERFIDADIDVALFHESLLGIVHYLNFVHEAYVVKAMGIEAYGEWLETLPDYLQDSFIEERFEAMTRRLEF